MRALAILMRCLRVAKQAVLLSILVILMMIMGFVITAATRSSVPLTRSALAFVNCADPVEYLMFCCPKPCPVFDSGKLSKLMQQQATSIIINQLQDQLSGTSSSMLSAIGDFAARQVNGVVSDMATSMIKDVQSAINLPSGTQNFGFDATFNSPSFSWDQITRPSAARTTAFQNSPLSELSGRMFAPVEAGTSQGNQDEAERRAAYVRGRMTEIHALALAALAEAPADQSMVHQIAPLSPSVGQFFRDDLAQNLPSDAMRTKLYKDVEFLKGLKLEALALTMGASTSAR